METAQKDETLRLCVNKKEEVNAEHAERDAESRREDKRGSFLCTANENLVFLQRILRRHSSNLFARLRDRTTTKDTKEDDSARESSNSTS